MEALDLLARLACLMAAGATIGVVGYIVFGDRPATVATIWVFGGLVGWAMGPWVFGVAS